MADVAAETAYYLNSKIPALALVAKGVRFPAGMWIRVAEATVPPWQVEDMLGSVFSALRGRMLRFESFTSEDDAPGRRRQSLRLRQQGPFEFLDLGSSLV